MHAGSRRREAALDALAQRHHTALLVTDVLNVRYLTGFTGSAAALLLRGDRDPVLATDGRYVVQAAAECPDLEVLETRAAMSSLTGLAIRDGSGSLAIEADHVSVSSYHRLTEEAPELDVVPLSGLVEGLRAVKDAAEIAALRLACDITDLAFADIVDQIGPGVTERDVSRRLLDAVLRRGGQSVAFDSIVAFGENSAIPHHQPTDRPAETGDLVKLDFGAKYAGYHADMTRTCVIGSPMDWQRDLHSEVADLQADCVRTTVPGAVPKELNRRAARRIEQGGHRVAHGLGHGVGLQIHEAPFLTAEGAETPLAADQVVTVEPGIYLPGSGGVRVEDTVLVTETGCESLTRSPRGLIEL